MTKRVIIAGAGGFGRGVLAWLHGSPNHLKCEQIDEVVFIDDADPAVATDAPVVGTIADYEPQDCDEVLCAIAAPSVRRPMVHLLASKGAKFHTFVADQAVVASNVEIGVGSIVAPGTVISANARLGSHVQINFNCSIGHDAEIEMFSTLSPAVNVMGEVRVGEGSLLGGGAVVLPRLRVGRLATVGAGAVVLHEVHNRTTVVGNPAVNLQTPQGRLEE